MEWDPDQDFFLVSPAQNDFLSVDATFPPRSLHSCFGNKSELASAERYGCAHSVISSSNQNLPGFHSSFRLSPRPRLRPRPCDDHCHSDYKIPPPNAPIVTPYFIECFVAAMTRNTDDSCPTVPNSHEESTTVDKDLNRCYTPTHCAENAPTMISGETCFGSVAQNPSQMSSMLLDNVGCYKGKDCILWSNTHNFHGEYDHGIGTSLWSMYYPPPSVPAPVSNNMKDGSTVSSNVVANGHRSSRKRTYAKI